MAAKIANKELPYIYFRGNSPKCFKQLFCMKPAVSDFYFLNYPSPEKSIGEINWTNLGTVYLKNRHQKTEH